MSDCISRLNLMRFCAGDATDAEKQAIQTHLDECSSCRVQYETMQANVADFKQTEATHLKQVVQRIETDSRRRTRWMRYTSVAAAVMAASVLLLFSVSPTSDEQVDSALISFKGTFSAQVVAKRDAHQFEVKDQTVLKENDQLRVVLTTDEAGFVFVFSSDNHQNISSFYPETQAATDAAPLPIPGAGRHELPGSIVLDDSVGKEQLVIVFSPKSFRRDQFLESWRIDPSASSAGKEIQIKTITIVKE